MKSNYDDWHDKVAMKQEKDTDLITWKEAAILALANLSSVLAEEIGIPASLQNINDIWIMWKLVD